MRAEGLKAQANLLAQDMEGLRERLDNLEALGGRLGEKLTMLAVEQWLDAVYETDGDREKLDTLYDEWARNYDQDLWASGNPYICTMSGMVGRYVRDRQARILDAGCGTGNMGQILQTLGYEDLVGLDASDGMLKAAGSKGCYAELYQMLLGSEIDLPDESFDAITAAGVLTHGHAPPESLEGLLKLAKPGAPIIFSISHIAMETSGFGEMTKALEDRGAWTREEYSPEFRTYPFSEQYADLRHWICVYRKH